MRAELSLTIMSLGGGVQSSVMALMASQSLPPTGSGGAFGPRAGLRHLRRHPLGAAQRLRARRVARRPALSFPLYVVDNGRSLREDLKALTNHSGSRSYVDIPVYLKGRGGEGDGIGRRQCTDNYKIRPIRRKIREMQGLRPRQRVPAGTTVELWLGMSTDEAIRMKTSRDRLITNRYPLMEKGMSRQDCADWWTSRYDRPPGALCPFQSRHRWVETKRRWPELFARGRGDRRQIAGRAGIRQRAVPARPSDASGRGGHPRRGEDGRGRAEGRVRE